MFTFDVVITDNHTAKYLFKQKQGKSIVSFSREYYAWESAGHNAYSKWRHIYFQTGKPQTDRGKSARGGIDCLTRAAGCTEWEWPLGSRPFFWRWGEHWREARDGAKVWVSGKLPRCLTAQKPPRDSKVFEKVRAKLSKVRRQGYISEGEVVSLIAFFEVLKTKTDIRMVYNATESGLNESVWAPWFALPTVETHLRAVEAGTCMADNNVGDMVLNFMLDMFYLPCKVSMAFLADPGKARGCSTNTSVTH